MNKLKLQWKIFGFLLGFCALLLVILWIFQTVFLRDMYKIIRKVEIDRAIMLVEKNIDNPSFEDILYNIELTNEITIRRTQDFIPPIRPDPNIHNRKKSEAITKVKKFVLDDGNEISLTFYAFVTPVEATVSTLKLQLIIITGIMMFLAILLAIIISKIISKPIEQINQSAKMLTTGNYEIDFKGEGYLEIKELSDTLNIATRELSKVERLRRELMANISHDLRTPLALIYSYSEMMHDFPSEITSEQTQIIMDETKRLTLLVNDVLDISSIERGVSKLNRVRFNFTENLEESINRMRELVKDGNYQLEFENDGDVYLFADKVKLNQAFYNLLLNAIAHCGDVKKVTVKQIIREDIVKIEVIDYGDGIKQSDLPYIWERYYSVDKNHNRSIVGTGLGLSIVKKVIEMHDGEYGVDSEYGKGSVFWFSLKI
ncbi:MAG: HAMP domain-containing sensor histidine kinase [Gudongella sp.]|nr:HAMP domain-containing sensor histidine kinase [Gudongella sp.]